MVYVLFILVAAVTVYAAMKLSTFADVISSKTSMGGLLVGTILLAGATSLPEVTTSISAVVIGSPDIAVGNVLGSNLFNLFILAMFDLYFRSKRLYEKVDRTHLYSAILGIVLTGLALTGLLYNQTPTLLGVGIETIAILIIYIAGLVWMNKKAAAQPMAESPTTEEQSAGSNISVKKAVIGFAIAAVVIMAAGTALSILGDQIAVLTGLGASFIGSFLIAATTSLPEAVSVFVALRLRNVNLAFGSILGSNLFNMLILVMSDVVYNGQSILNVAATSHIITGISITFLSFLVMYTIQRKRNVSGPRYILPSIITVLVYFGTTYLLFAA
ncbi:cation transporter [Chryseomicrobium excrementi]|uniref:Cation transporter n=1 Tax=Chryseomicrobium excrementi TaxID=2041346 RepID=A0A2M9EYI1_9BACL|nr:sodium:calcium antiporter [Chryseomicrobium excrementi]PJK16275.1 cation transporter [Chryseomicrobium excrementi]